MKENGKYRFLQGGYWMLFCTSYGYVTYYLMGAGYTSGQIGVLTALFCTLAALLQPVIGRLADRGGRFGWKPLLQGLSLGCLTLDVGILFCTNRLVMGLLYGACMMLISSMMPLVNAVSFYYRRRGARVDFGTARGTGSLSYAVLSLLLGRLTVLWGAPVVPLAGIGMSCAFFAIVCWLPYRAEEPHAQRTEPQETAAAPAGGVFFARYPVFTLMLAGSVLVLSFHNITNTYLYQMLAGVGGNSGSLGTALAIAALAEIPVMFGFSRLIGRFRAAGLLFVSGCAFAAKAALFLAAGSVWAIYAVELLQMPSFALFASASVYYAEHCMAPRDKVTGQAFMTSTITAGSVMGNLLGGWVLDRGGVQGMLALALALALAGAAVMGIAAKKSA